MALLSAAKISASLGIESPLLSTLIKSSTLIGHWLLGLQLALQSDQSQGHLSKAVPTTL